MSALNFLKHWKPFKKNAAPTRIKKLGKHICYLPSYHETDRPILAVVSGDRASLIVDSGNSPEHALLFLSKIASRIPSPPGYVAITHHHWDHVFGIAAMNLPTLAHRETITGVTRMARLNWGDSRLDRRVAEGTEVAFCSEKIKKEIPASQRTSLVVKPPDTAFENSMTIDLGGVSCRLEHVGGDHAADSCVVFVPEESVLFLGDCLFMDIYNGPWSYSTKKLLPLLEKISNYNADIYVPSHSQPMKRQTMNPYIQLLKTTAQAVEKYGDNRQQITNHLEAQYKQALTPYHAEQIDYFINGIRKEKMGNG